MDLATVKAAPKQDLVACAVAAAANAQSVVDDAELLALSGRRARACFLAELAVEEVGKAFGLMALSLLPKKLKGQAPIWQMLEWHELKLVGGLLVALTPPGVTLASTLSGMSTGELAEIINKSKMLASDQKRLKQRGLYVDMDSRGCITRPSEVTQAEVSDQLAQARQAVSSARALLGSRAPVMLASPPVETVELAQALTSAITRAGSARTAEAAADIVLKAVIGLREQQE